VPDHAAATAPDSLRDLARGRITLTRIVAQAFVRHPSRTLAWIGCGGAACAIFANILLLQPEQHSAPLFFGTPRIHPAPIAADVPLPQARPTGVEREADAQRKSDLLREIQVELARRGFFKGEPDGVAGPRAVAAIREFQSSAGLAATGEASEALLAALLTGGGARPRDPIAQLLKPPSNGLDRPSTIAAAQRALTRLGYGALKEDGQFGPGTRIALDRFAKDRKLPPYAENPSRVMRELAQASGIAIE